MEKRPLQVARERLMGELGQTALTPLQLPRSKPGGAAPTARSRNPGTARLPF